MMKYAIIAGVTVLLIGTLATYFVHTIQDAAVLKNELQEAQEDEIRNKKELEIANRPDANATNLLKRMRNAT